MKRYIIAEIGSNWEGSVSRAKKIIQKCNEASVDAVKFQMWRTDDLYQNHPQYDLIKRSELTFVKAEKLKKFSDDEGIEFFCSPFYPEAVDFLDKLGVKRFKVASRTCTLNDPHSLETLKKIAETKKPVIISMGMGGDKKQIMKIFSKNKTIFCYCYYQDYSYVVKTSSSINTWRDRLIAAVHPAGWEVFGQVDIATAVQSIANITSIVGLGGLFKLLWRSLIGRRLGTADQGTINPYPDKVIDSTDKADATPCLRVTDISGTFTNGQTITGSSSGATGLVFSDSEDPTGHRFVFYTSLTGIFTTADVISAGAVSAQVVEVWGLLGQYDLLLSRYIEIITPPQAMSGQKYGFAPAYRDIDNWKWVPSQVAASTSSRTFGSMNVYPVYINKITTISSGIDASTTTIPVTATDNLPAQGTIKLGTEEITYTGRSYCIRCR